MIGKEYTSTAGNTIKILSKVSKGSYTFHCSVCSSDTELFPEPLLIAKSSIYRRGTGACGCSSHNSWSPYQYKVRLNRSSNIFGFDIIKWWENDAPKNTDKITILVDGRIKKVTISNALIGKSCSSSAKKDYNYYKNLFENQPTRLKGTVFYKSERTNQYGWKSFWEYYCPACSNDKYVKSGLCSGLFNIAHASAMKGLIACRCGVSARKTFEMRDLDIQDGLYYKGWRFLGYTTEDLKTRTKFEFLCDKGHKNKITYRNFMRGDGCSTCSNSGFSRDKPAYLYLTRWYGFGESYIKFGITNKHVEHRVNQQASKSKLDHQILKAYYSEDGGMIADAENSIKLAMKDKLYACPEKWLPDGFSETVLDNVENFNEICKICEYSINVL